jgi:putative SOS response-associated peptidase YedK
LQWGLLPFRTKQPTKVEPPINARAETVGKSLIFRGVFAKRRAIVPADAFYERRVVEIGKQPLRYRAPGWRANGVRWVVGRLPLAGRHGDAQLRHRHHDANAEMAELHDRMPVILEPADWPVWIGEVEADPASLLHPAPDGTLRT